MLNDYGMEFEETNDNESELSAYFPSECTEMYKMHPPPPKLNFQQLICQYKASSDPKYFLWFLHYYEPHVNETARSAAMYYAVRGHWIDLKAEIIATLWEAAQEYSPDNNIDFLATVQHRIDHSIHNYIRTMRTGFTVHSEGEYKRLRSIIAEYRFKSMNGQTVDTAEMAKARGISETLLIKILQGAFRNTSLLPQYLENDEGSETDQCQNAPDLSSDPAMIYQIAERDQALYDAFQSLTYREKRIISAHLGFCPHCFTCRTKEETPIPKQSFRTIAVFHELKEKAVARIYYTALNKISEKLAPILF